MVSNTLSQQFPEELTESKTTETPPCDVVLDKPVRTSAGVHQRELPPGAQPMCCAPYWLQPVRPPDYLYPVGLSVPKFVPWAPSWMVFPVFLFRVGMSLHHRERGTSPVLAARHFRTHFGIERVTVCTDHNPFVFVWCTASHRLRAGCRNARLTARLANRGLTVTKRLTCGRVARSTVSKPLG